MYTELWQRLQAEPNAGKSTLQIESERSQREYQASLNKFKPVVTAEQRAEAKRRFAAINAVNDLEKQLEQDSIVAQRAREVAEEIAAALKDVATPDEVAEVCRRAEPLLKRFVTSLSDYQVTEWVGHTVEAIRAEKNARELAG